MIDPETNEHIPPPKAPPLVPKSEPAKLPEQPEAAPPSVKKTAHTEDIRPEYYGGKDNPYEVRKVAEAWGIDKDAYLFNVLKYIARAGKKNPAAVVKDLRKARTYINFRLATIVEALRNDSK